MVNESQPVVCCRARELPIVTLTMHHNAGPPTHFVEVLDPQTLRDALAVATSQLYRVADERLSDSIGARLDPKVHELHAAIGTILAFAERLPISPKETPCSALVPEQ